MQNNSIIPPNLCFKLENRGRKYTNILVKKSQKLESGCVIATSEDNEFRLLSPIKSVVTNITDSHIELCVAEKNDAKIKPIFSPIGEKDWHKKDLIIERIKQANIFGMGGAGFPSYKKLQNPIETIVINAVECEPAIYSDHHLTNNYTSQINEAIKLIKTSLKCKKIFFAIKKKTKLPAQILQNKLLNIVYVSNDYPSGKDRIIYRYILDTPLLNSQSSRNIGLACINVATLFSIYQAVALGFYSCSRLITVSKNAQTEHSVIWAMYGSRIEDVIENTNINYDKNTDEVVVGGLMMGKLLTSKLDTVDVSTIGIFVRLKSKLVSEFPCIQCNKCSDICPENLLPQIMHKLAKQKNIESLDKEYSVTDCISCGICDFVCPSNISLVDAFIKSKNTIRENAIKKEKSNIAASRHEQKLYRKDEEKKQRDMKKKLAKEKKELELIEQSKIQPSKTTSENYQIVHAKNMLKKAIEQGDNELIKEIEISINELSKITK